MVYKGANTIRTHLADPEYEHETSGCTAIVALLTKDNDLYVVSVSRHTWHSEPVGTHQHMYKRAMRAIHVPSSALTAELLPCLKTTNLAIRKRLTGLKRRVDMWNLDV